MYDGEVSFSSTALVCNLRKFCRVSLIVTAIVGGKLSPCESCQIQTMSSFSLTMQPEMGAALAGPILCVGDVVVHGEWGRQL